MPKPSIDDLILRGIIEVSAIDDQSGQLLYSFTDKVYDLLPEMIEGEIGSIQEDIMYFVENGFLEMEDPEDEQTKVRLTKKAFNKEAIAELPEDKQEALINLKRFFER